MVVELGKVGGGGGYIERSVGVCYDGVCIQKALYCYSELSRIVVKVRVGLKC